MWTNTFFRVVNRIRKFYTYIESAWSTLKTNLVIQHYLRKILKKIRWQELLAFNPPLFLFFHFLAIRTLSGHKRFIRLRRIQTRTLYQTKKYINDNSPRRHRSRYSAADGSLLIHSYSGSTTRQMSFPQCWHFPRRIRSLPSISAVSRRIVTEPRHLPQKTLSRIFFWAHSGIFSHRLCPSGVKVSPGWIGCIIFLFQPNNDYTVCT